MRPLLNWREPLKLRLEHEAANEEESGRALGEVLPRAPAQVLRLAAVYAALEPTSEVAPRHLEAATEVWRYSVESTRWIFGMGVKAMKDAPRPATGPTLDASDVQRVFTALQQAGPGGLSRGEIHRVLGARMTRERMDRIRDGLVGAGRIRTEVLRGRRGRPGERWRAT